MSRTQQRTASFFLTRHDIIVKAIKNVAFIECRNHDNMSKNILTETQSLPKGLVNVLYIFATFWVVESIWSYIPLAAIIGTIIFASVIFFIVMKFGDDIAVYVERRSGGRSLRRDIRGSILVTMSIIYTLFFIGALGAIGSGDAQPLVWLLLLGIVMNLVWVACIILLGGTRSAFIVGLVCALGVLVATVYVLNVQEVAEEKRVAQVHADRAAQKRAAQQLSVGEEANTAFRWEDPDTYPDKFNEENIPLDKRDGPVCKGFNAAVKKQTWREGYSELQTYINRLSTSDAEVTALTKEEKCLMRILASKDEDLIQQAQALAIEYLSPEQVTKMTILADDIRAGRR